MEIRKWLAEKMSRRAETETEEWRRWRRHDVMRLTVEGPAKRGGEN